MAKYDLPGLAFLDFSGVRLLLEKSGTKATLNFGVDDIKDAYEELRSKGVEFTGETHFVFNDDAGVFGKQN